MSDLALDLLNVAQPSPPPAAASHAADRARQESFDDCLCRAQAPDPQAKDEERRTGETTAQAATAPQDATANEEPGPDRRPDEVDDAVAVAVEENEQDGRDDEAAEEPTAPATAISALAATDADTAAEPAVAAEAEIAVEANAVPGRASARASEVGVKPTAENAGTPLPTAQNTTDVEVETAKSVEGESHARPRPQGEAATAADTEPVALTHQHVPRWASPPTETVDATKVVPASASSESKPKSSGKQTRQVDAADVSSPAHRNAAETATPVVDPGIAVADGAFGEQRGGQEGPRPKVELRADAPPPNAAPLAATAGEPSSGDRPATTAAPDAPLGGVESRGGQPRSASPSYVAHGAPAGDRTLTDVERARLVQRVARAFQAAGDGGTLRLRLSPPELGSLRLEVAVRDGVMHARLEAESSGTRSLLLESLPALRERLAQQDIRLERFDVDLMGGSPGGLPQQAGDDRGANERQNGGATTRATATVAPVVKSRADASPTDGRLNVVI